MSGSPILQNGRLVGAVTHVLVNDPTRGYGIFAQTMLEQAQQAAETDARSLKNHCTRKICGWYDFLCQNLP